MDMLKSFFKRGISLNTPYAIYLRMIPSSSYIYMICNIYIYIIYIYNIYIYNIHICIYYIYYTYTFTL